LTAWQSKARLAIARENRETLPSDEGLFERLCRERAPWFDTSVSDVDWFSVVRFDDGLAREFGRDHVWLAGDAAHRTSPVPVHGLNVSLADAPEFAEHIEGVLTDRASLEDLVRLGNTRRARWLAMLDGPRHVRPGTGSDNWVRRNATRIAESVPAARADLATLLGQIGIELEPSPQASPRAPSKGGSS
jgi:2-polyprenyl-6-methoxyphenol hydroxylase-like FAD-dependent oxidoreductase